MSHPFTYTCSHCHSTDVRWDAWAEWDSREQRMVLAQDFDDAYCMSCDGECSVVQVPCDENGKPVPAWRVKGEFRGKEQPARAPLYATLELGKAHHPEVPEHGWESVNPEDIARYDTLVIWSPVAKRPEKVA